MGTQRCDYWPRQAGKTAAMEKARESAYGWWTREAGMLKTVSLACGCGEILSRDGVEPIEVAREGRDLGWRVVDGHWMCVGCAGVAGETQ